MGNMYGIMFSNRRMSSKEVYKNLRPYEENYDAEWCWDTEWRYGSRRKAVTDFLHMKVMPGDLEDYKNSESFISNSFAKGDYTNFFERNIKGYFAVDACKVADLVEDPYGELSTEDYLLWFIFDKDGNLFCQENHTGEEMREHYKNLMAKYPAEQTWITVVSVHK